MLRVPTALSYVKRTIRPLYANTQATPGSFYLDPAWSNTVADIYPGMALMKTSGQNVTLLNATGVPFALSAFYEAPLYGITEITNQGVNACAAWVLGPDAQFQILAPAFDSTLSWTDPGDGTILLVSAYTSGAKRGQLCLSTTGGASTTPIARLIAVNSSTSITIGGLQGRVA